MKPIATLGVGCLIVENGQVLLVKPNYGKAKGHWILPGGFIEAGEALEEAALRELLEETGQRGEVISPFCVRYRRDPVDVYWVLRLRRTAILPLVVQKSELMDVRFLLLEDAIQSPEVRPMTRYFLECSLAPNPAKIPAPRDSTFFFI